jgi:plastocyanin
MSVTRARSAVSFVAAVLAGAIAWSHSAAAAAEPRLHSIRIERFSFVPERLEIEAGDRVEWINEDIAPHTATAPNGAWDTGSLSQGQAASVSFAVSGRYEYRCRHHPQMRGEIVVVKESAQAIPD